MNNKVVVFLSSDEILEFHRAEKLTLHGCPVLSAEGEGTGEILTVEIRQWYPHGPINAERLVAGMPAEIPAPVDSVERCRELLAQQAREAPAFDEHHKYEADLAADANRELQRQFNDYVAALVHVAGLNRAEAIRRAVAVTRVTW